VNETIFGSSRGQFAEYSVIAKLLIKWQSSANDIPTNDIPTIDGGLAMGARAHFLRILAVFGAMCISVSTPLLFAQQLPANVTHLQTSTSYGKSPQAFEPNIGQTSPAAKFLSRGRGYTLFLTNEEAILRSYLMIYDHRSSMWCAWPWLALLRSQR
jgi:hypothetical protein